MASESREHAARTIESAVSVLLVDDDESLCGMMGQMLPYYGMRLDAVHNGYLGLREALEGRHDLLLLDMRLPGIDGLEVLRQVRRRSHVPVIMITASSDEADRVSGLDAPTITSPSPSASTSSWLVSAPFCAGPAVAAMRVRRGSTRAALPLRPGCVRCASAPTWCR